MPVTTRFLIVSAICLWLPACPIVGSGNISDLNFISAEIINYEEQSDIRLKDISSRSLKKVLIIRFSTDTDILNFVRAYEYNVGVSLSYCDGLKLNESALLQGGPYIYDDVGVIDRYRLEKNNIKSKDHNLYRLYVNVKSIPLSGRNVYEYDIGNINNDVCMQLRGGNMFGNKFYSNVVVIDKNKIITAIKNRNR